MQQLARSGDSQNELQIYEYVKVNVINEAHYTEINCIEPLPFQSYINVNFATGARNEIKLWNSGRCMHTIPNSHQS
jgi:hypothetical protein